MTEETDTAAARSSERLEIVLVQWLHNVQQLVDLGVLRSGPPLRYPGTVASEADGRAAARWLRQETGLGTAPINSIVNLCERSGQWVLVTDLPGDGASLVEGTWPSRWSAPRETRAAVALPPPTNSAT
ncbi:hypothetical protein AB0B27_08310 [Micromonospora rifamycinica]|uniref:hypothetical protein n=1 Tax=Micromonospora rifamycinica TaxID=291594 RepID=UPI0033CA29F7